MSGRRPPELANTESFGRSLAALRRKRGRSESRRNRKWGGLVFGVALIAGAVLVLRGPGRFNPWIALLLWCAGGASVIGALRKQSSRTYVRIVVGCLLLCWGVVVLAAFERGRIEGVYVVAEGAIAVLVAIIIRRAFRPRPPLRRGRKRGAVDIERVTSIPVAASASERWQGMIAGEMAEDRRWRSLGQSLMIGLFATGWCALAVHLAAAPVTDPGATILGFAMAGACVAVFIWSLFSPLRAWIAAGVLLVVTLIGLASIDRATALRIGFSALLAWLASLAVQLRGLGSRASDERGGSGGHRGVF